MDEFVRHINRFNSLREMSRLQRSLTADFCVKYLVFNDTYTCGHEDSYICFDQVIRHQKHSTMEDLCEADKTLEEQENSSSSDGK
jgi:hypothetical protein